MRRYFKDHFSETASEYSRYRPVYPDELFSYLASITPEHEIALDCATGNGQCAIALANYYKQVIAIDASKEQISNAQPHARVQYKICHAEHTALEGSHFDLVTVAQALHWFDVDTFAREVDRLLKPEGILAVWSYELLTVNPLIDQVILDLYRRVLDKYWPPERAQVESGYRGLNFPFTQLECPEFSMQTNWSLDQLIGYLGTWSAVQQYREQVGSDPLESVMTELSELWGNGDKELAVQWPLNMYVFKK